MDREIVLVILALCFVGPMVLACGPWPLGPRRSLSARQQERLDWSRVWLPLVPGTLMLAALFGWALAEPENAERVPFKLILGALPFAGLWIRAVLRAVHACGHASGFIPAGTVGLLRPRVVMSSRLIHDLDPESLRAACAHEEAHVRHRDPLRILLAQCTVDLQWPWPAARERFLAWRRSLEMARDEEARTCGADGADLAAAILFSVRLAATTDMPRPLALLIRDESAVECRLRRLLEPVPPEEPSPRLRVVQPTLLIGGLLVAGLLGAIHGEAVIRALLGAPA